MYYKVTLTSRNGLSGKLQFVLLECFKECRHAYLVTEYGESRGNCHLEGVVEFDTEKTSNVTDRIRRVYERLEVEVIPKVTIRVKKATHLVGALIYARKELAERDAKSFIALQIGWTTSWIDEQVKDNVKDIPHSMLKKRGTRLTQVTGPALMFEWCTANNKRVTNKGEYLEIVRDMAEEGYMFGSCRTIGLYQDVCALFGDGMAAQRVAESDLRFIDC